MDCNKNLIRHIFSRLSSDFEEFYLREICYNDFSLDEMKDHIEHFEFLVKEASSAIQYLCENKIENFDDLEKFDENYGGTPAVDVSSEAIFGYEWRTQHKAGFIPSNEY